MTEPKAETEAPPGAPRPRDQRGGAASDDATVMERVTQLTNEVKRWPN